MATTNTVCEYCAHI